jgi:Na+:H+ antiporter, NhaA family
MKSEKIDYIVKPITSFINRESTAGILLFFCAMTAMLLANSPFAESYHHLWDYHFTISFAGFTIDNTLHHWISDGLMAMFFFVVGLELKREILGGELSTFKKAILPLAAAAGGMLVPAVIFLVNNSSQPEADGWGIPMATDIAFALGILALLGKRVPVSLKIFLTALAIADDLGAVLVIAFFYTSNISLVSLGTGAAFMIILLTANYLGVRNSIFYGIVGIGGLWLAFLTSGVHATVAGVLVALAIPARTKIDEVDFTNKLHDHIREFDSVEPNDLTLLEHEQMHVINKIQKLIKAADTPLQRLEHAFYPIVSFIVMPLFAFANAGVTITSASWNDAMHPVSLGVFSGLLFGKFIGVVAFSWIFVKLKWAQLPEQVTWRNLCGVALLAGIGFTMSLFITNLAFQTGSLVLHAKMGILAASLLAGTVGYFWLRFTLPKNGLQPF